MKAQMRKFRKSITPENKALIRQGVIMSLVFAVVMTIIYALWFDKQRPASRKQKATVVYIPNTPISTKSDKVGLKWEYINVQKAMQENSFRLHTMEQNKVGGNEYRQRWKDNDSLVQLSDSLKEIIEGL
jgi:hypothetical protein